jgi:hypothetical protein
MDMAAGCAVGRADCKQAAGSVAVTQSEITPCSGAVGVKLTQSGFLQLGGSKIDCGASLASSSRQLSKWLPFGPCQGYL